MVRPMAGIKTQCQGWFVFGGLIRTHFHAPRIGADRGDLFLVAPIAVLEPDACRGAARAPLPLLQATLHLPGANDDEITPADFHILRLCTGVEFVVRDLISVFEVLDLFEAGDVKQHALADHSVSGVLDPECSQTVRVDQASVGISRRSCTRNARRSPRDACAQ